MADLFKRAPGSHRTGPEQDHAARLAVVRTMHAQGCSLDDMAETLDMLALLPGQELQRGVSGTNLTHRPGEGACGPRSKASKVYVPN